MRGQEAIRTYQSLYRRRRRRRFLRVVLLLVLVPLFCGAVWLFSQDAWQMLDLEKIYASEETLLIKDRDGTVVSRLYRRENRVSIGIDTLPDYVKNAFLAAEDARFYSHPGFDLIRIAGAALHDLRAGSYVEGASTVT